MRRCRHFSGLRNKTCAKGVVYDEIDKDCRVAYRAGLPCFKRDEEELAALKGMTPGTCPHASFPTLEEAQETEKEINAYFMNVALARKAIDEHSKGKRGVAGVLECPICKAGQLRYTIAECNGHCHAGCSTKGCVQWME